MSPSRDVVDEQRGLEWPVGPAPSLEGEAVRKDDQLVLFARARATNPSTSPILLETIARTGDEDLQCLVAQHPAVSEAMLKQLASSPSLRVCVAVASNGRTPADVLAEFTTSRGVRPEVLLAVAGNESTPEDALAMLALHAVAPIRQTVARNRRTGVRDRKKLLKDPTTRDLVVQTGYLISVAERTSLAANSDSDVRQVLAYDAEVEVRRAVLHAANAYERAVFDVLAEDSDPQISSAARAVIATDPSVLNALAQTDDQAVLRRIWQNSSTHPSLKLSLSRRLDYSKDENLAYSIAAFKEAPGSVLEHLAIHGADRVRREVAKNPGTGASTIRSLAADRDAGIRALAVSSGKLPSSVLDAMINDSDAGVLAVLAASPRISEATLTRLALSPLDAVRLQAVQNPAVPSEVLTRLARSHAPSSVSREAEREVILAVAQNPRTDPDALLWLARDASLATALAANSSVPEAALETIVDDLLAQLRTESSHGSSSFRSSDRRDRHGVRNSLESAFNAVARNSNTPVTALVKMSGINWMAPRYTTRHVSAPMDEGGSFTETVVDTYAMESAWREQRAAMMQDVRRRQWAQVRDRDARVAFAAQPDLPAEVTAVLADDDDSEVRSVLAANKATQPRYFRLLAQDDAVDVRISAARAPRREGDDAEVNAGFDLLSRDRDRTVRSALIDNQHARLDVIAQGICESDTRDNEASLTLRLVRRYVAQGQYGRRIPPEVLSELVGLGSRDVWELLRKSASTPNEVLGQIASSATDGDSELLESLLNDVSRSYGDRNKRDVVTRALANNESVTSLTAKLSACTEDPITLAILTRRTDTADEVLLDLARAINPAKVSAAAESGRPQVLEVVAENPVAPVELLRRLAERQDASLNAGLLRNPSLPEDLFITLVSRRRAPES